VVGDAAAGERKGGTAKEATGAPEVA